MAMYTCYYDASSTQNQLTSPLVVVGLLSTEKKWLKGEREWDAVLREFGVPYLHMKQFAHSRGPFATWKGDERKRGAFLLQLAKVLKRRVNIAFQYRLVPEVFHKLDREYTLTESLANPYAFTTFATIQMAHDWFKVRHPADHIGHVVEQGDAGQSELVRWFAEIRQPLEVRPKVDPETERHFMPFQAADLFAYEGYLNISRHLKGEKQTVRKSLAELRKIPIRQYFCDEEVLRGVIANVHARHPDLCIKRADTLASA